MDLDDLRTSKYLTKKDIGRGLLLTITSVAVKNVAMEGEQADEKAVVYFREHEKPMVMNATNGGIIAQISGHEHDIDKTWVGTKIVVFFDPNVQFRGKITGGIRVRAPKAAPVAAPVAAAPAQPVATPVAAPAAVQPQPAPVEEFDPVGPDDPDLPF